MNQQRNVVCLVLALAFLANVPGVSAGDSGSSANAAISGNGATSGITPGTQITTQNWQKYKDFMPDGMAALFHGTYFWKMPADVSMEVGPTIIHPLPPNYLAATEKYSSQIRIIELPSGGLNLTGYQGGIPFPTPAEPHKGWKILANLWFRYIPHLAVDTYARAVCG
jgi:hypothetical protein